MVIDWYRRDIVGILSPTPETTGSPVRAAEVCSMQGLNMAYSAGKSNVFQFMGSVVMQSLKSWWWNRCWKSQLGTDACWSDRVFLVAVIRFLIFVYLTWDIVFGYYHARYVRYVASLKATCITPMNGICWLTWKNLPASHCWMHWSMLYL